MTPLVRPDIERHMVAKKKEILHHTFWKRMVTVPFSPFHLFAESNVIVYYSSMNYRDIITIDASKRGGQPTIRGMRITVYDILKMLASGMKPEDIVGDFPELTTDDIRAALSYASQREGETVFATHEITARSKHIA